MDIYTKYDDIPKEESERISLLTNKVRSKKSRGLIPSEINRLTNMTYKSVHFVFYIVPKATPRPRFDPVRKIVYVRGAAVNKKFFREVMKDYKIDMIVTPCKFTCDCYLPTPSSMSAVESVLAEMKLIRPVSKPDWDNLGKAYSDMIQGVLLQDDSIIIEGLSRKYYSIKPRVEITIDYMSEFDSKYNENKILKRIRS